MFGRSCVGLWMAAVLSSASALHAAPPQPKAKPAAAKPAGKGKRPPAKPVQAKEKASEQDQQPNDAAGAGDAPSSAEDAKNATQEERVKAAGTAATQGEDASRVKVKEDKADKEGVKTYQFETVEVEGRLKSPQVIYFLRRVRAEFEAGALGHRSFLGELSDSRRSAAFR